MNQPHLDDIVDPMTYRELLTMVKAKHKSVQFETFEFGATVGIRFTRAVTMPRAAFDLLMAERNLTE